LFHRSKNNIIWPKKCLTRLLLNGVVKDYSGFCHIIKSDSGHCPYGDYAKEIIDFT